MTEKIHSEQEYRTIRVHCHLYRPCRFTMFDCLTIAQTEIIAVEHASEVFHYYLTSVLDVVQQQGFAYHDQSRVAVERSVFGQFLSLHNRPLRDL